MNRACRLPTLLVTVAMVSLASCTAIRNAGGNSVAAVKNSTSAAASRISSFAKMPDMPDLGISRLLPGQRVKVVEVREKDLRELPTGHELAQAHARQRQSNFWIFGGPVDFVEPTLPEAGADPDGSLLPPKIP